MKPKIIIEEYHEYYKGAKERKPTWIHVVYPNATIIMNYDDFMFKKKSLERRFDLEIKKIYKKRYKEKSNYYRSGGLSNEFVKSN